MLTPELSKAGARQRSAAAPDPVTLDWLNAQIDRDLRVLRLQYSTEDNPTGTLPSEDEQQIAALQPPSDTTRALRLWRFVGFCYMRRWQGLERKPEVSSEEARAAAAQLLQREPIRVTLESGRVVNVTGRGYSALQKLASVELTLRWLHGEWMTIGARVEVIRAATIRAPMDTENTEAHRQLAKLVSIHSTITDEMARQRQELYRVVLTPHGGLPRESDPTPDWLDEITPSDDMLLLSAVIDAGPGRLRKLGTPPEQPKREGESASPKAESWGWGTVFASLERELRAPMGSLYNADIGQLIAWARASAGSASTLG